LHDLLLGYNWAVDFVLHFSTATLSSKADDANTEKQEVRAIMKYLHLKGMTLPEICCDMKEILEDSAFAYSIPIVTKWHAVFIRDRRVMTCTDVDDPQLLSTKKLLKKSTNLS